jgi:hypothetical protein
MVIDPPEAINLRDLAHYLDPEGNTVLIDGR